MNYRKSTARVNAHRSASAPPAAPPPAFAGTARGAAVANAYVTATPKPDPAGRGR
jgi:hypothetical protein